MPKRKTNKEKNTKDLNDKQKLAPKGEAEEKKVGYFDPKRRLADIADALMKDNIAHELRTMIDANVFQ